MGTVLKVAAVVLGLLGLVVVTGATMQASNAFGIDPEIGVWLAAIAVAYVIYRLAG